MAKNGEQVNDGGPAWPVTKHYPDGVETYSGMTLRDYFAGQVLGHMIYLSRDDDGGWSDDTVAQGAYMLADAMLRTRGDA